MDKIIDWKNFEIFVKELYESEGSFKVERNVIEIGKSEAKRQIDVKLTLETKFHTFIIIIECKFWKERINRSVIDSLYATIDDLNASKGVLFTTKGYEEGAIKYAKSKNIDLYLIRDLTDEEWGMPGREVRLYLRLFAANIDSIQIPKAKTAFFTKTPPDKIELGIEFAENQPFNENLYLYSKLDNSKGKHLIQILLDTRISILKKLANEFNFNGLNTDEFKIGFKSNICLDFKNFEYCVLNFPEYIIWLDNLHYKFVVSVNQSKLQFDRGKGLDFALIVENYIKKQPLVISKVKEESTFKISEITKGKVDSVKKVFENDTGITAYCEHWVKVDSEFDFPVQNFEVDNIEINRFYGIPEKN